MKKLLIILPLVFMLLSLVIPDDKTNDQLKIQFYATTYSHEYFNEGGELKKGILINTKEKHFYALITNQTGENVIIWEEMCSWGYANLYFELLDKEGNIVYTIKKNDIVKFGENNAQPLVILPHETYVREVNFTTRNWSIPTAEDLPKGSYEFYPEVYRKSKEYMTVTMRAVFEIKSIEEKVNNWSGKIVSPSQKVNLVYPWKPTVQNPTE